MKEKVYFSKTERVNDTTWRAHVAPVSFFALSEQLKSESDTYGNIEEKGTRIGAIIDRYKDNKDLVLVIRCENGFPCVGREYSIYEEELPE